MEPTEKIKLVLEALKSVRGKDDLAEKVGCTPNALYKIATGFIVDPRSSLIDALCRELHLDPVTGLPLPARTVRATVPASLRARMKKEQASGGVRARTFNGKGSGGLEGEIPEALDLSETEAVAILKARGVRAGSAIVTQAMILIGVSDQEGAVKEAIRALTRGEYYRAIELAGRLGQNRRKG